MLRITGGNATIVGGLSRSRYGRNNTVELAGGSLSIGEFDTADAALDWTDGELTVHSLGLSPRGEGENLFPDRPVTIEVPGVLSVRAGDYEDAEWVTLRTGDESLLIEGWPADEPSPLSQFATVEHRGMTHTPGQALVIPAGRTVQVAGQLITDPVDLSGTLRGVGGMSLSSGLTVRDGGLAEGLSVLAGFGSSTPMVLVEGGVAAFDSLSSNALFSSDPSLPIVVQTGGDLRAESGSWRAPVAFRGGTARVDFVSLGQFTSGAGRIEIDGGHLTVDRLDAFRFGSFGSPDLPLEIELTRGTLDVGSFSNPGSFNLETSLVLRLHEPAEFIVRDRLDFSEATRWETEGNAEILLRDAEVFILGRNSDQWYGWENLTLRFEADDAAHPDGTTNTLEAAILHPDLRDADSNQPTAWDAIEVGRDGPTSLTLTDHDNNQGALRDAVYVRHLIVHAGSSLDLGGVDLIADHVRLEGDLLFNGGRLLRGRVIPEPGAIAWLVTTALVALRRRRL